MTKINKARKKQNGPKNRKQLRKEQRKEKKQRKFEHYQNKNKPGKFVLNPTQNNKINNESEKKIVKEKKSENLVDLQMKQLKKEKEIQNKLQKQMLKQRKRQMKEANIEEDRNIKHLEKQLKLNKRKNKKTVPKSFSVDGLDYLLEVCDPENMKNIADAEKQFVNQTDEFEDDFELVTGKNLETKHKSSNIDEDDDESDITDVEDLENDNDELDGSENELSEEDENNSSDFDDELSVNEIEETNKRKNNSIDKNTNKKKKVQCNSDNDEEFSETEEYDNKRKIKNNKTIKRTKQDSESDNEFSDEDSEGNNSESEKSVTKPDTWEDIYGRTRTKDGGVISNEQGKYIPPALRATNSSEKLLRLKKQLKGLLNRVAASNMHSIASQIEEMYMANSRNDMNETLTQLVFEALISPATTPERLLIEYVSLITILHANIGTEVGAHFLQTVVKKYDELYNQDQLVENKELDNAVHILAQLYNFKVYHSQLLYQILEKLNDKFEEKHIECILLVLKNVGFSLRKDDPNALKNLIINLQKKATSVTNQDSRVKYMLDILLAIKNNNVSKIPNYDTSYSEHMKKLLKSFIRKGNYVTQLNISLEDLLKVEERGRWWIVGSAWTGTESKQENDEKIVSETSKYNQKILDLARKQRMNTDTRRNIFCILMTAENCQDAFEKLVKLGLKNQQEREIIHVLLHCNLQEKQYNPYYGFLAQKFCEYDRKYQMMIRCSVWDKLKTLTECSAKQISILSKLLIHLFLNQGLPISTLKVVHFSELDQITLRLIRQVLIGILLHEDQESCLSVFEKVAVSPKLKMFRESIRLFIHHFLLRNLNNSTTKLSEENTNLLQLRVKLVEKLLASADSKIRL